MPLVAQRDMLGRKGSYFCQKNVVDFMSSLSSRSAKAQTTKMITNPIPRPCKTSSYVYAVKLYGSGIDHSSF